MHIGNSTHTLNKLQGAENTDLLIKFKKIKKILISRNRLYILIEKWLVELNTDNKYQLPSEQLLKILSISEVIEDQGSYMKMQIIKKNVSK